MVCKNFILRKGHIAYENIFKKHLKSWHKKEQYEARILNQRKKRVGVVIPAILHFFEETFLDFFPENLMTDVWASKQQIIKNLIDFIPYQ